MYSQVPVINAGDGGHHHPTQTLTDLLTIKSLKGTLHNHVIGICGDLKYGRTVQSLITAMSRYENIKFVLISPKELRIPQYIRQEVLDKNNIEYCEVEKIEEVIESLDILYMTRIQKERFFNCGRNESCEKRRGRRFRIRWKYRSCSGRRTGDCRQDQRRGASAPCTADPHEGGGSTAD